jgi:hypothetical protein
MLIGTFNQFDSTFDILKYLIDCLINIIGVFISYINLRIDILNFEIMLHSQKTYLLIPNYIFYRCFNFYRKMMLANYEDPQLSFSL